MCGIAGSFSKDNSYNAETVLKMLEHLRHRGPLMSDVSGDDNCCLGHTRLEIVGGASGKQPVVVGDVTLTFNGEIYNYLDLRTDLIRRGCRFKTKGDAEVIANAYIAYGDIFVEKLKGIFAFALYDSKRKVVLLCRDRMGVKPLYYVVRGNTVFFASEIKALVKGGVTATVDDKALCHYLHFQYCLGDRTLFKGIKKVLPSELITFGKDLSCTKLQYWTLRPWGVDVTRDYYTDAYYEDQLLSVLHKVVGRQRASNMPFGIYASGGIDSSIVAALVSEYEDRVMLISGKYQYPKYDESRYVKMLADKINPSDMRIYEITEADVTDTLSDAIYAMDEPCAGSGLVGQYVLAKNIRRDFPDVKVMMGGQGGDELFCGYSRYVVAYLESCIQGAIYPSDKDFVLTLERLAPLMPILQGYENMLKGFFKGDMFGDRSRRYFDLIGRMTGMSKQNNFCGTVYEKYKDEMYEDYAALFSGLGPVSYFTKMTYFDMKASLPALLQVDDRVNGAFALESRVPLLDDELVELSFRIPPGRKLVGGYSKGILRRVMAGLLPEPLLKRRDKMGFPVPMQEWLDEGGKFKDIVVDVFSRDIYQELFGAFDPDAKIVFDRDMWGKLSLCLWFDIFNVNLF